MGIMQTATNRRTVQRFSLSHARSDQGLGAQGSLVVKARKRIRHSMGSMAMVSCQPMAIQPMPWAEMGCEPGTVQMLKKVSLGPKARMSTAETASPVTKRQINCRRRQRRPKVAQTKRGSAARIGTSTCLDQTAITANRDERKRLVQSPSPRIR